MLDHITLSALSDNDLIARLQHHRRTEHMSTFQVLRHLNEVERRKLHLQQGASSLFVYCVRQLKYSESAAGRRVQAARCMRRFRSVERLLERNEISISVLCRIAPLLNEANVTDVLSRVRDMSRRDVDALVAGYQPPVALRDRIEPVRVVVPAQPVFASHSRGGSAHRIASTSLAAGGAATPGEETIPMPSAAPATETKLHVQFLASVEFMKAYDQARALLSNRLHSLSMECVLTAVLGEFIEKHSPAKRHERREARAARTHAVAQ